MSEKEKEQYQSDYKHIAPDLVDGVSNVSPASDMYIYIFKNIIIYFPLCADLISVSIKNSIKLCMKYNDSERPSAQTSFCSIISMTLNVTLMYMLFDKLCNKFIFTSDE